MSKSCLNSNEERRERTATNSSVTKSGTRRENAFFFRIAIGREREHNSRTVHLFSYPPFRTAKTVPKWRSGLMARAPGLLTQGSQAGQLRRSYGVGDGVNVGCGLAA